MAEAKPLWELGKDDGLITLKLNADSGSVTLAMPPKEARFLAKMLSMSADEILTEDPRS